MKKPTALGGSIFAGLFTQGVLEAEYEVLGHLEDGPYGVATARLNYPGLDVRIGAHNWRVEDFVGKVDFMYTNPPCAAWSNMRTKNGHWNGPGQVERMDCIKRLVDAGLAIGPKAWCWESVMGAWRQGREFVIDRAREWMQHGYHATVLLQDNQYLGTPQRRQRMFLIAHKHPLMWPALTKPILVRQALKRAHKRKYPGQPKEPENLIRGYVNLWKLAGDFKGRMREAMNYMEANGGYEGSRPVNTVLRLDPDKVAPVMLASFMRWHPTEPRILNWNEWLALVGLPQTWKSAQRSYDGATRELARAVMPDVGRWLGVAVKDGLKKRPLKGPPALTLVDFRTPEGYDAEPELIEVFDGTPVTEHPVFRPPAPPAVPPATGRKQSAPRNPDARSRPGSGARIREMLQQGCDVEYILATIHREFPQSKATKADVAWNRGRLRKMGVQI